MNLAIQNGDMVILLGISLKKRQTAAISFLTVSSSSALQQIACKYGCTLELIAKDICRSKTHLCFVKPDQNHFYAFRD